MKTVQPDIATETTIDPENPWLGLSSYSEETRAYFHGRDEEAAELARRVQRKLLTVLFGQSGLGKTSLLRAGLVPRLRGSGFCPVYVRIDYAPESPPPAEQIKQAIFKVTAEAGYWTRAGSAVAGESLWEFLHHRGDLLRDANEQTLLPLLIFDQFEEIFTLAQADDAGRQRAKRFLDELADLVENRPPADLERRLEEDEANADDFDFARADYRILISLREDYLAHLESVKGAMPSITQNRMRLARMTGEQALSAVIKPGGKLVSQEVAESIVRFVAGGSELPNAEVEPSLLSLICRELNTVRQAQGKPEISADLLAGSRDTILTEFYERALADQPAGVRRVIEDELLTESGYRESLAEERVAKALAAAGAEPDALAKLVDRRLLRIEERLDMRRVELTHDVLCGVVRSSRNLRHEREARDEAERQLAEQQERAAETRRTLHKTRRFAMIAAGLMLVALVSAVFGWVNWTRARAADQQAQKARADAEKLVGFLIEDFYAELEPTGRLETMGKLAHMAVSYYDDLPEELLTPQTQVYRGMALIREAGALFARGDFKTANPKLDEAWAIFDKLRAQGVVTEDVVAGLALAKFTRFSSWGVSGAPGSKVSDLQETADLLRPWIKKPGTSAQTRMLYSDVLNYLSHTLPEGQDVAACEEARAILLDAGARNLADLRAASIYADTTDSQARHLLQMGKVAEAERLEAEVYSYAEKVLAKRPGDLRSMANRALAADLLGRLAIRRHDYAVATDYAAKAAEAGESYVRFNPSDLNSWVYWVRGLDQQASVLLEQGRIGDAIDSYRKLVALDRDARKPASLAPLLWNNWGQLTINESRAGQFDAARKSQLVAAAAAKETGSIEKSGSARQALFDMYGDALQARLDLDQGNNQAAFDQAAQLATRMRALQFSQDESGGNIRDASAVRANFLRNTLATLTLAALRTGRYGEAEAAARERAALPPNPFSELDPQDEKSRAQVTLAHALVLQGRADEARAITEVEILRYRAELKAGVGGLAFTKDYSYALYVDALARPAGDPSRDADLAEALRQLDAMGEEANRLVDIRELRNRIGVARSG
ncbi:MAG: hypothetical protein IPF84_16950 [Proteobacteria bacterium]|nr:hypothetical protein [Pseudomonadota bacterium]